MQKRGKNKFLLVRPSFAKRGQFYLITTVIIVSILVGFASLSNFAQQRSSLKFYQFGEELKIESGKVLDYGTKKSLTDPEMNDLFSNFTQNYVNYSEADNFYFIFGSETDILFMGFQRNKGGVVNITAGTDPPDTLITLDKGKYTTQEIPSPGASINMTVPDGGNELRYNFIMKSGKNFYFVISKEIGGDRYIASNT